MTIITLTYPQGRLTTDQRAQLARTLTDAVLVPETGLCVPEARWAFQVHFRELAPDFMAIGGSLLAHQSLQPDIITIDIAVMDAAWPHTLRAAVIDGVLAALTEACRISSPSPTWWVNFRVIDEGSWGSRGGVLSILDLLETGAFSVDRVADIQHEMRRRG